MSLSISASKFKLNLAYREGKAVMSSVDLADLFDKRNKHICRQINHILKDHQTTGANFEPSEYKDKSGKKNPMFWIDRKGAILLIMGFTGSKAIEFKLAFIDAFEAMEKRLMSNEAPDSEWCQSRLEGKKMRRDLTDAIKDYLIPLAMDQGSKSPEKLYMAYTRLLNDAYIEKGNFKKRRGETYRDFLSLMEVNFIAKIEERMAEEIIKLCEQSVYYKDIFKKIKAFIMEVVGLVGKCHIVPAKKDIPRLTAS